jgi:hypothetical protein
VPALEPIDWMMRTSWPAANPVAEETATELVPAVAFAASPLRTESV